MTSITVERVSKQFKLKDGRTIQAVDDVSLKVSEGGSLAIIGPSGCGKTTLLRIIAGLEKPDSGKVLYNDEELELTPHRERGIGMVFQNFALIPQWDSEHNIGFFLRLRNRQREIPERVRQVSEITKVDIEELLNKFPRQLSGGEKQKVTIARAFARDLKILLFDEPFANIDAKLRQTARLQTRRLLSEFPVTTVYVTHDQQEASLMSDRIVVLRDGKVVQVGDYQSLYENPNSSFVAQFIGLHAMNLFHGWVQDGKWHGTHFGGYSLPSMMPDGKKVLLGVRPQKMQLGEGELVGTVETIIPYLGEKSNILDIITGDETWQLELPLDSDFKKGDRIAVQLDRAHILFFDAETGARIS